MFQGFRNRREAGLRLGNALARLRGRGPLLVLGLPRGGVPVAGEVARELDAPLDVLVVRKVGVPGQPELAMGAVASGGVTVVNADIRDAAGLSKEEFEAAAGRERREVERRERSYRAGPAEDPAGKTVIIVDDGFATGSTAEAAARAARLRGPKAVILAVPVAPPETVGRLRSVCDEVVALEEPEMFGAVGSWYEDFAQTTDDEVRAILGRAAGSRA